MADCRSDSRQGLRFGLSATAAHFLRAKRLPRIDVAAASAQVARMTQSTSSSPSTQKKRASSEEDRLHLRFVGLRGWLHALWRTWQRMDERNLGLIAAGVAFYAFLSIFPAMAAVIAIWGYWADPIAISEQMDLLTEMIPEVAYQLIDTQITQLISTNRSTLQWASIASIVVAIWTARASVFSERFCLCTLNQWRSTVITVFLSIRFDFFFQ